MHRYETLIVLLPGLPEAQVRETVERARRLIESMEGQVEEIDDWGTRDLAYALDDHNQGNYVLLTYKSRSAVVVEFERTLKLADEVLRFISLRLPPGGVPQRPARRAAAPVEAPAPVAEELPAQEGNELQ